MMHGYKCHCGYKYMGNIPNHEGKCPFMQPCWVTPEEIKKSKWWSEMSAADFKPAEKTE